jgi:hypothetical protein
MNYDINMITNTMGCTHRYDVTPFQGYEDKNIMVRGHPKIIHKQPWKGVIF